jgi:hypothetical protein
MTACTTEKRGEAPAHTDTVVHEAPAHADAAGPATDSTPVGERHDEKPAAPDRTEWKTFQGNYFDVRYPAAFSAASTDGKDGVLCMSPDGLVAFYVYSPQWNGASAISKIDEASEVVKLRSTEVAGSRRIVRVTYERKDDHRMRSFEDVEDTLSNTRRIFGIMYSTPQKYSEYRDAYLKFKGSLKQYAD